MSKRYARTPCPTATKFPYGSRELAEADIARIVANADPLRETLPDRVYRCECRKWHLTSTRDRNATAAPSSFAGIAATIHAAAASA